MAVGEITTRGIELALQEFQRIGLEAMLKKYGGRASTRWYVKVGHRHFDQKVLLRAAHRHEGLGDLPSRGSGRFNAGHARRHLANLKFCVVDNARATPKDLKGPEATGPLMRWLTGAARQRTTITYGEARARLEQECGFGSIFPRNMGLAAGAMQYRILDQDETAPLLHVLLVRGSGTTNEIGKPGDGAQEFLAARFPEQVLLQQDGVRGSHPELWAKVVGRASNEVYDYRRWEDLHAQLYGDYVADPFFTTPAEGGGTPRGGGGEGPNHKALRLWVKRNPHRIDRRFREARAKTEEELLSGDRVDVMYYANDEILAIEVKSRDSNWADLQRGIYQCVKYQAVLRAQERGERTVRTLLVTESDLRPDLENLARRLDIRHLQVQVTSR